MFLPPAAAATLSAAPSGGRHLGGGTFRQHRRERHRGAGADRLDVEPEDRGGQQPDIGQARIAPADARIVLEHLDRRPEQIAQAIALAGLHALADAEEQFADTRSQVQPA